MGFYLGVHCLKYSALPCRKAKLCTGCEDVSDVQTWYGSFLSPRPTWWDWDYALRPGVVKRFEVVCLFVCLLSVTLLIGDVCEREVAVKPFAL